MSARDATSAAPRRRRSLPVVGGSVVARPIVPRIIEGRWLRRRRWVALSLMLLFAALPFVTIGGAPAILLDVAARRFHFFGATFLPTDGVLLMFLLLTIFAGILLVTALVGRAWCGWACPQTVYMDFLFRPLERWVLGAAAKKGELSGRRLLLLTLYAALSVMLGNLFLSYFVGYQAVWRWMQASPTEAWTPFLVMAVTAGLVFFDFAYFREQTCTVVCPYARLQSVLLDPASDIIAYDVGRGEPRGLGKRRDDLGSCVDCNACVTACPTGIDIRNGLQLECIACAQCVDACDAIMDRTGQARGLIRYATQLELTGGPTKARRLRPRVLLYAGLTLALLATLVVLITGRAPAEVTVLRGTTMPWVLQEGKIRNQLRVKVANHSLEPERYSISTSGLAEVELIAPENPLPVAADGQATTTIFVLAPPSAFRAGRASLTLQVTGARGFQSQTPVTLLGPMERSAP